MENFIILNFSEVETPIQIGPFRCPFCGCLIEIGAYEDRFHVPTDSRVWDLCLSCRCGELIDSQGVLKEPFTISLYEFKHEENILAAPGMVLDEFLAFRLSQWRRWKAWS